jgi:uncharacterized hydrophobic protein (TIGR00271 family)
MNTEKQSNKIGDFFDYLKELVDLRQGIDKKAAVEEIKSKDMMTGANAWMLMSSIVIASIGLDLNSPAVIIGAMLISPLMSPILSMGLGIATNDRKLLERALRHLGIAVLIAIITSTIYFALSPFNELTSEIEARLEPTALDVFIAFFGGIAGIISYVRKDISTAIPGVAIATALMPPLCVVGYSLSGGQWNMAMSSFYLFFLNSFFVALATFLILRYLKFPYKTYVNSKDKRRNNMYIMLFSFIVIIPSLFLFNRVLSEARQEVAVNSFIEEYIGADQIYLDDYQLVESDSIKTLILKVYGDKINEDVIPIYLEGLVAHGLDNTYIEIIPTSEIKLERLVTLESKLLGVENISKQLEVTKKEKEQQKELIEYLHKEIETNTIDSSLFLALREELQILYPDIAQLTIGTVKHTNFNDFHDKLPVLIVEWPEKLKRNRDMKVQDDKIKLFVQSRIQSDTLLYYSMFK